MGYGKEAKEKPVELILYEQMQELQVPLLDGGLMDQPHIWMLQYAVVKNRQAMWRSIVENATKPVQPK